MEFGQKKFREIDLFDFMSFSAWTFLIFLPTVAGHFCYIIACSKLLILCSIVQIELMNVISRKKSAVEALVYPNHATPEGNLKTFVV